MRLILCWHMMAISVPPHNQSRGNFLLLLLVNLTDHDLKKGKATGTKKLQSLAKYDQRRGDMLGIQNKDCCKVCCCV